MFLPHFDVLCDLFLDRRREAWNTIWLKLMFLKLTRKTGLLISPFPTSTNTKMAIKSNLLSIQNAAISLFSMHSKESWLVQGSYFWPEVQRFLQEVIILILKAMLVICFLHSWLNFLRQKLNNQKQSTCTKCKYRRTRLGRPSGTSCIKARLVSPRCFILTMGTLRPETRLL